MSGYIIGAFGELFDPITGAVVGTLDQRGREQLLPTFSPANMIAGATLSYARSIFDFMTADQVTDIVVNGRAGTQPALDHSSAFQAAINSGIGFIKLPAYTYNVQGLTITGSQRVNFVVESGPAGSLTRYPRIQLPPNATADMFNISGLSTDAPFLGLDHIDVYGNNSGTARSFMKMEDVDQYTASHMRLESCFIRNFTGRAIWGGQNRSACWINDCLIASNGGAGLYLFSNHDWRVTNCDVGSNGGTLGEANAILDGYCSSHDFINTDCYFAPNQGLYIGGGTQAFTMIGGQVNNCGDEGIYVDEGGSYAFANRTINFTGVTFISNSTKVQGAKSNIYSKAPLISVTACSHLYYPSSVNQPKHGIEFQTTNCHAVVQGGVWDDSYFFAGTFTNLGECIRLPKITQVFDGKGARFINNAAGAGVIVQSYQTGQSGVPAYQINDLGSMRWGPGDGSALDLTLQRVTSPGGSSPALLYTPQAFRVGSSATSYANTIDLYNGAAYYRYWTDSTGRLRMKSGLPSSDTDGVNVGTARTQLASPTTGATVAVADSQSNTYLWLTPAAGIAALTVTLPTDAASTVGQEVFVGTSQVITALTVNGASSVLNAPTTMAAGTNFTMVKIAANVWMRKQ